MFDNIDPAVKQYFIFALVIALILSGIINFALVDALKGTYAYGFPINLANSVGIGNFFARVINTLIMGGFLAFPIYFGLKYLRERS